MLHLRFYYLYIPGFLGIKNNIPIQGTRMCMYSITIINLLDYSRLSVSDSVLKL